jgi:perosamine synthetase
LILTPRIPIVRPSLGDDEIEAVSRVIRSGWLSQGPEVVAFEDEFSSAVGATHAVAVANCTAALQMALIAVGVAAGDDVVTVSHSFVATANAVIATGARPIFVDVQRETLGMDPSTIERAITLRTKAILCVHQIGIPCDLDRIIAIADRRGLPVVEDAACAIGSELLWKGRWERIGRPHGSVACFSFHPRKVLTTGDGGMLTTGDEGIAARLRRLRQHAMTISDTARHQSSTVVFEDYLEPAFNFRMTDLQAAIGRVQLARLDIIVAERRALAARFQELFRTHPVLTVLDAQPWARSNWQSYPVFLRDGCGVAQVAAMQHVMDRGIACKRGIANAHQEAAYAGRANWAKARSETLAESERLRDRTILLPLFHGMVREEQDRIVDACSDFPREARG